MALAPLEELEQRARELARRISAETDTGVKVEAVATNAVAGGGSLPGVDLSSWGVAIAHPARTTASVERSLRHGAMAVVSRIEEDILILDLRTVMPEQDENLANLVVSALRE
jgi:L-seryl-tRNA(Ser) seleniumtransferase